MNLGLNKDSKSFSPSALFQEISDICETVNEVNSTKELLEISLKRILDLFGAQRGSIFILDDNQTHLTLNIAIGKDNTEKDNIKRIGEGIIGKVAKSKEPIFVKDISQDKRFRNYKARKGYQTASFLCAPLMVKDKLIGVINITDKHTNEHFHNDDLLILDFLTSQIALNYKRVELYHKFRIKTQNLQDKLGKSDKEALHLKKQIHIHERLATIGKLTGGIAHEFNNPLDGVMRYTNLCLDHMKEDEVVRGYLLEIKYGLNRMANIVKNLLACSRNESEGAQSIHFSQVLNHSLTEVQTCLAGKQIEIQKQIQPDLPTVKNLGLERVITNILRNAIDAIETEGKITVSAKSGDTHLIIDITDTGLGIEEEELDNIFEPFYTTKDIQNGCGLGLTIAYEIIKNYSGKIDIGSTPNQGTTFTISIPFEEPGTEDE